MEPSPFTVEFGRRVARRRRILGLKQWQIAELLGVRRSHITQLERGAHQLMRLDQLARLADVLETSADYLLQRTADDPGVIPPRPCPGEGYSLASIPLPPVTSLPREEYGCEEYSTHCPP
jgi:transcriptional regulator with XRE-family HTH domain